MTDSGNKYEQGLSRNPANSVSLSPLTFLKRAAAVFPDKTAVIHGERRISYRLLLERCIRLASALRSRGVRRGDTVAVMAPNTPALLEAHFGVAMAGAVLNALNTRLDSATISFILKHADARIVLVDRDYCDVMRPALQAISPSPEVIDIVDPLGVGGHPESMRIGNTDYETFLGEGDPALAWEMPADEWQAISLNYTSGTTGDPKGVVYHHRGAYLNAVGNALAFNLRPDSVYLWTLPMFHCNGWSYPWAVTLMGATHVCLRRMDPVRVFSLIREHGVTHLCGAPIVLNMLINASDKPDRPFSPLVAVATGGAAPPSKVIAGMKAMGFSVTHLYGLTESFGPSLMCEWQASWDELDADAQARKMARQGVPTVTIEDVLVLGPDDLPVPCDGTTLGEIAIRGNTVMKGYLKNPAATQVAFRNGWFRSGDLAVCHEDGYIEVRDRSKDIIISGGENISSLEVEEVLFRHPAVLEAAVVARPDDQWGETPCAFVTLKPGVDGIGKAEIIAWCRAHLAHFKCPRYIVFTDLPRTSTGKVQKYLLRAQAMDVTTPG